MLPFFGIEQLVLLFIIGYTERSKSCLIEEVDELLLSFGNMLKMLPSFGIEQLVLFCIKGYENWILFCLLTQGLV